MALSFGGDYPQMERFRSGLFSLDLAVGGDTTNIGTSELGFPLRTLALVYSRHTGIGKSMFVFSIAGRLSGWSKDNPDVVIMPTDTFSRPVAEQVLTENRADGHVEFVFAREHEKGVASLEQLLRKSKSCCAVFDGIAAYEPSAVREAASIQDTAMGKHAQEVARLVSKLNGIVKTADTEKIVFLTTSLKLNMGGFNSMGYHPKGGDAPKERSSLMIDLNWTYAPTLVAFPNGRLLSGEVQKNSFGPQDKAFRVWMSRSGIHRGMTAAYDCVMFGLATGGKSFTDAFSVDGVKIGSPKKLGSLPEDAPDFDVFYELLENNEDALCKTMITKKSMKAKLEKEVADKKGRKKDTDNIAVKANPETGEIEDVDDELAPEIGFDE
jgi:acylphosphatase